MPSDSENKKPASTTKKKAPTAEQMAAKQQEISVTEFFEKNKQILGFDSRSKSLLMGIKEAVDNSLDACEEANILPDIEVRIDKIDDEDYHISIEDNGPGIVYRMIPNVFGRLLYGSRFHALRQSRGQQGIGISATVMYGNITTGKPAHVVSKIEGEFEMANEMDIVIDTKKNRPITSNENVFKWEGKDHGTRIEYTIKGRYITGKQSVFEYLKNTAIVNPHAQITFHDPEGKKYVFERATDIMPPRPKEIKPHPEGMEIGDLLKYSSNSAQKTVAAFLKNDFSRITDRLTKEILDISKVDGSKSPGKLTREEAIAILDAIKQVKIMAPPTDCLSPIGDTLIKKGLMHVLDGLRPEYYATPVTRSPKAVNGNPFVVEAGIVYGGDIPSDSQVQILRFANRVPLLYQQGACAITKAISEMDWRRYGLEQRGGKGIPFGPAIILVHVASTKVPFTSEGKEAVAGFPELQSEIGLALRLCARNLKSHLNKMERKNKTHAKFEIVQEILPDMAKKAAEHLGRPVPNLDRTITHHERRVDRAFRQEGREVQAHRHLHGLQLHQHRPHLQAPRPAPQGVPEGPVGVLVPLLPGHQRRREGQLGVKDIQPSTNVSITFDLTGDMADTFDADDIYFSGLNPVMVMGAEMLPGDWGIKGMEIVESADDYVADDDEKEEEEDEDLDDE